MTAAWPASLAAANLNAFEQRLTISCHDALPGFREAWCKACGRACGVCERKLNTITWPPEWEALVRSGRIPDPLSQEVKVQEGLCQRVLELLSSAPCHFATDLPQLNYVLTQIDMATRAHWRAWLTQRLAEDAALWNNFVLERGFTREQLAVLARGDALPESRPEHTATVATPAHPAEADERPTVKVTIARQGNATAPAPDTADTGEPAVKRSQRVRKPKEPLDADMEDEVPKSPRKAPAAQGRALKPSHKAGAHMAHKTAAPELAPPVALLAPADLARPLPDDRLVITVARPEWWTASEAQHFVDSVGAVWAAHAERPAEPEKRAVKQKRTGKRSLKRRLEGDLADAVKAMRLPKRFVDRLRTEGPWDLASLNAVADERLEGMGLSEKQRSALRKHILSRL